MYTNTICILYVFFLLFFCRMNRFWENIIIIIDRYIYQYWICPKIFCLMHPLHIQSKIKIGNETLGWTDATVSSCVHFVHFVHHASILCTLFKEELKRFFLFRWTGWSSSIFYSEGAWFESRRTIWCFS